MKALAAALFALTCAGEAHAWNARGHMMVATVAWDHLTPAVRARASALIRLNPHYGEWTEGVAPTDRDLYAFVRAATWADEIKGEEGYTNGPADAQPPSIGYDDKFRHTEWHYKDLAFSPDGTPQVHALARDLANHLIKMPAR